MHHQRSAFLVSVWFALAGCTEGIDTIAEGYTGGSRPSGSSGASTASGGSGISASTGTSGSNASGTGGSDAAGAGGNGAGGDVTAGSGGTGDGGAAGQATVEAGADAKPDAPAMTTGLAAYWKLDEAAGTTAADSSGHNHTATVAGATWVVGKVGAHAASFNGTAYAEATGPVVDTSKPYTVAAWVQLSTVSGFRTAVSIDGASVSAFFIQLRGDSGVRFGFSALPTDTPGAATFAIGQATPVANTWYHIAGVFDGVNLKLYVNGAMQDSKPFTTPWAGTGSTAIGRGFYSGARADFWPGLIDDVRLYGSALSDADIAVLATP